MCYDVNALPPEPPGEKRNATGRDFVLTATDGVPFNAYLAEPMDGFDAQVLIYPDIRGLHQFYKELAMRFAEVGVRALALDYFGRTAGLTARDDEFDFMPHVQQMTMPTFYADVSAALAHLQNGSDAPTFIVGFCRGGSLALYTGSQTYKLAGLIPFYAGLARQIPGADGTALQEAHKIHYPTLGLFGGDDPGIPHEQIVQLDGELDKANVEHKIVIYENAPHSFFDRKQTEWAEASANAWERVLGFIKRETGD
ncbi:MAG: hypothetical protein B6D41_09820 [Chloroflexi bacterium UTCFX4]|nr:MAG: hypothetical protein B6D41_09820 [Chloroflexi bacterium UTCFX4]